MTPSWELPISEFRKVPYMQIKLSSFVNMLHLERLKPSIVHVPTCQYLILKLYKNVEENMPLTLVYV
jgi:hypothetical protein